METNTPRSDFYAAQIAYRKTAIKGTLSEINAAAKRLNDAKNALRASETSNVGQ